MLPELQVLKLLLDYTVYEQYRKYVQLPKDQYELARVYGLLDQFFERHNRSATLDEFQAYLMASITFNKASERDIYTGFFTQLRETNVQEDLLETILLKLKERCIATELGMLAFEVADGKKEKEVLQNKLAEFGDLKVGHEEENLVTDDLQELLGDCFQKPGLRWRLDTLNKMLGSLRPGDAGFITARPETGKTTFLASEATYMASQCTDRGILWINNEEQGKKVKLRCYQAALGMTIQELATDPEKNSKKYIAEFKSRLHLIDDASIGRREIEKAVKRYNPLLVLIDQADKLHGFKGDREDLRLTEIYQWIRELSKAYQCAIIGVCQAGDSATNKKWIYMDDAAGSKTGKAGEADFIIGIGKIRDPDYEFVRFINISKNKLLGDPDTVPELRHGQAEVFIRPEIARYEDII